MRGHFWPFTGLLGEIWRFVTRKVWGLFHTDQRTLRIGERSLPACRFRLLAEMHLAMHNRRTSRSVRGKPAANYRPGACAPRKITSARGRRPAFAKATPWLSEQPANLEQAN